MNGSWLLLPLLLLAPAADDKADDKARLLADDLRFAENLALHRFFNLASSVVSETADQVESLKGEAELAGEASLIQARILTRISENTTSTERRLEAQTQAIEMLREWSQPGSPFAFLDRMVDALEELAGLLRERGKGYARQASEGADESVRKLAESDFREAEKAYEALQDEAEARARQLEDQEQSDAAQALRERAFSTLYLRGLNSIEWAEVASDRELRLEQAIEQLDEFQWETSDEKLIFYEAMYEQARAYHKLGEAGDARALLDNILELAGGAWEQIDEFNRAVQAAISRVFDKTWTYLALLEAEAGDMQAADAWISTLLDNHAAAQDVPISPDGLKQLLEWAQRLELLGDTARASEIIKRIVDDGRDTPVADEASQVLARLVKQGDAGNLSVSVLMDAAKGSAASEHWADAAYSYARAAASLNTPEEVRAYAFDAWTGAGQALRQKMRFLEAAVAFEQALAVVQELDLGTEQLERTATRMYNSYNSRFEETQHPFDKQLRDQASDRLLALPGIELDLAFMRADEAFAEVVEGDAAGYEQAMQGFQAVPESSPNYERALVSSARCLVGAGRLDEASTAFAAVEARFDDPALEPTNAAARNRREIAMAQARYHHAELLLDVDDPQGALDILEGFEQDVPSQSSFLYRAKYLRVSAYCALGQVDEAEAALAVLLETTAEDVYKAGAAFRVAQALEQASREKREAGDTAEARDLLIRAAEAMWTYSEKSGFNNFTNLVTTGEWYLEADMPADAQRVFEKAIDQFSKKVTPEQMDRATIGLATAFDKQQDFGRARPLWLDLVSRDATTRIRRGAARSFGGWLETDENGNVVEVSGGGNYQEAHDLWVGLWKASGVSNKFTSTWWEAKLGIILTLSKQGASDTQRMANARLVLDQLKGQQPNFDEDTKTSLAPEQQYEGSYKALFRYLDRRIPAR